MNLIYQEQKNYFKGRSLDFRRFVKKTSFKPSEIALMKREKRRLERKIDKMRNRVSRIDVKLLLTTTSTIFF